MATIASINKQKEEWNELTGEMAKQSGNRGLPLHLSKQKKRKTRLRAARANRRWVAYSGLDGLERAVACRLENLEMTNFDDNKTKVRFIFFNMLIVCDRVM